MQVYEDYEKATCYQIPLSKRKLIKKAIEGLSRLMLIIIAISFIASMWGNLNFQDHSRIISSAVIVWVFLTILTTAALLLYNHVYIRNYYYDIRAEGIVIRKGVLMKKELSLAYEKVQEVYIDQDLLDKLLGIYDVHLKTAAEHSEDFAHIDGLSGSSAQKIKGMIIENIRKTNSA
ncbi:MAG: PH domain-containing protein [Candidatus Micrarchaeia archaeon]